MSVHSIDERASKNIKRVLTCWKVANSPLHLLVGETAWTVWGEQDGRKWAFYHFMQYTTHCHSVLRWESKLTNCTLQCELSNLKVGPGSNIVNIRLLMHYGYLLIREKRLIKLTTMKHVNTTSLSNEDLVAEMCLSIRFTLVGINIVTSLVYVVWWQYNKRYSQKVQC